MEPLVIRRRGLLWRLALLGKQRGTEADPDDICTFTKRVLLGLLLVVLGIAGVVLVTALVLTAGWVVVTLLVDFISRMVAHEHFQGSVVALIVWALAAVLIAGYRTTKERGEKLEAKPREPSLVRRMYEAWKQKMCFKVTYED